MSLRKSSIIWIVHVPAGPEGGGVALTSNALMDIAKKNGIKFASIYSSNLDLSKSLLVWLKVCTSTFTSTFVLHSGLTPLNVLLITFSFKKTILLYTHGELLEESLRLRSPKKRLVLALLRLIRVINPFRSRVIYVSTSGNRQEIESAKYFYQPDFVELLGSDIFTKDMLRKRAARHDYDSEVLNIISVGRMVPNKGFFRLVQDRKNSDFHSRFEKIIVNVFYAKEDEEELERVKFAVEELENSCECYQFIWREGLPQNQIQNHVDSMTNRLLIIPSYFESFCYALVENLNTDFRPIVYFHNHLVETLMAKDLCIFAQNKLPSIECVLTKKSTHLANSERFLMSLAIESERRHLSLLHKYLGSKK